MVVLILDFVRYSSDELRIWNRVNNVIIKNLMDTPEWRNSGYEGVSDLANQMYGFRIQRPSQQRWVEFVFDKDEDYTAFLLKWA